MKNRITIQFAGNEGIVINGLRYHYGRGAMLTIEEATQMYLHQDKWVALYNELQAEKTERILEIKGLKYGRLILVIRESDDEGDSELYEKECPMFFMVLSTCMSNYFEANPELLESIKSGSKLNPITA